MHAIVRFFIGLLMVGASVALFVLRNGIFLIGATTVVEDAEGIPAKLRAASEFLRNQPVPWFYVTLAIIVGIGIALLVPEASWRRRFSTPTSRRALPSAANDHNITSYGQSGGVTAHTVYSDGNSADVRKRQEEP